MLQEKKKKKKKIVVQRSGVLGCRQDGEWRLTLFTWWHVAPRAGTRPFFFFNGY